MASSEELTDMHVVDLLKKDAGRTPATAPRRPPGSIAPRPNIRFLRNLVRDTDSHNTALLAKERQEARARHEKLQRQYDGRLSPPDDRDTRDTTVTKIPATNGVSEVSHERHRQNDLEKRSKDVRSTRERSHSRSPERKSKHRDSSKHERSSKRRDSKQKNTSTEMDTPKQKDSSKHKHKLKDPSRKRHRSESPEERSTNGRSFKRRHRSRSAERRPLDEEPSKKRRRNRSAERTTETDRSSKRYPRSKNREEKETSEDGSRKRRRSQSPDNGSKDQTSKRRKGISSDDEGLVDAQRVSQKEYERQSPRRRLTEPAEEDEKQARRRRRKEKKALISTPRSPSPRGKHRKSESDGNQQHSEAHDSHHAKEAKKKQSRRESNVEGDENIQSKSQNSKRHHRQNVPGEDSNRGQSREESRQKSLPEDRLLRIESESRSSTKEEKSTKKVKGHSKSSKKSRKHNTKDLDPLEEILGPLPPALPPQIRTRGRGKFTTNGSSTEDRLNPEYDPMIDLQPDSKAEDDGDQAVEAMRDRLKWQQAGADRLRSAGFSEEQVSKWEKSGKGDEGDVNDVRWKYRGEGREWDRGKVVKLDADDNDGFDVEVRADWNFGRLK